MKKTPAFLHSLGLTLALMLGACGGGGGGGGVDGGTDVSTTSISLTPALGALSAGASVEAYASDGTKLASGRTDANGKVTSLGIPSSHKGVVIVRVTGGTGVQYFDEGTGTLQTFGADDAIYSVLPASAVSANASFGVTPLTNLLAGLVGVSTTGSTPTLATGNATDTAIAGARQQIALMTGLSLDVLSAPDPLQDLSTAKNGSTSAGLYGVLLAEMAKMARQQGISALEQAKQMKQQGLNSANAATPTNDLKSLIATVLDATDRLQGNALLHMTADKTELNKFLAAKLVAKDPASVIGKSGADLASLIQAQDSDRSAKSTLLGKSPDMQGIWDTASGAAVSGSAIITADRNMVLRLSTATGGTRLVLAKFAPTDSGYTASGKELLMANDAVTTTAVDLTVSEVDSAKTLKIGLVKAGQSETFNMVYGSRYDDKVSLANFAGTWTDVVGDYAQVRWTITAAGAITGTSSSSKQCSWSGHVYTRSEGKGVADVLVTETCTGSSVELKGLATFKSGSNKGVARISLTNSAGTQALLLEMNKS